MRIHLVPAVAAVSLAMAGAAFASTTTGTIKSVDMMQHQLTLSDGSVYMLPSTFKDPGLKAGEKVTLAWELKNNAHEVSSVKIDK